MLKLKGGRGGGGGGGGGGVGVIWISSDSDDRMGPNIKTQKNPTPNF